MSNTDECFFCKVNTEAIEHLFWYCTVVKIFGSRSIQVFQNELETEEILTGQNVLLGYKSNSPTRLINHLINIVKYYIYKTKCSEGTLQVENVIRIIGYYSKLERIVAERRDKNLQLHYDKWSLVSHKIQEKYFQSV